ncbi:MAG: hypothetical protein AAGH78_01575 [Cyanobacteria bacterium P01_H01_bin.58]
MYFPLWKYLNQSLGCSTSPPILNPYRFWRRYQAEYLDNCFSTAFLEQCWRVNYAEFVTHYHAFCDRTPLEEDPVWLIERCWQLKRRSILSHHPENHS